MNVVMTLKRLSLTAACVFAVLVGVGCDKGESDKPKSDTSKSEQPKAAPTQPIIPVAQMADWCPEHAMPESICVQCNSSLVAGFKEKGDWCEEHNVPKSQDFAHHPELKEKFAAAYKEKFGKEPPTGGEHHDHDHEEKKTDKK